MEPFLGQIQAFAFGWAPQGWLLCDGSLQSIATNEALYSLLGTTYGGDGRSTFGLPDLRGRAPIGMGTGPGLSPRKLGELDGVENVTLLQPQMPMHSHFLNASSQGASESSPQGAALAAAEIWTQNSPTMTANSGSIGVSGGNMPHENMQPSLAINWCIACTGAYPPRP